jgi:Putative Actinobacterial Holin-X, holin superfamily III
LIDFHEHAGKGRGGTSLRSSLIREHEGEPMASESETASPGSGPHESLISTLLGRLFRETEILLLQELALVRAETAESLAQFVGGALVLLIGFAFAFAGLLAILAGCIALLAYLLPLWIASAGVGVLVLVGGAAFAVYGRRVLTKATLVPQRALQSWQDTAEWARREFS